MDKIKDYLLPTLGALKCAGFGYYARELASKMKDEECDSSITNVFFALAYVYAIEAVFVMGMGLSKSGEHASRLAPCCMVGVYCSGLAEFCTFIAAACVTWGSHPQCKDELKENASTLLVCILAISLGFSCCVAGAMHILNKGSNDQGAPLDEGAPLLGAHRQFIRPSYNRAKSCS